MVLPQKKSVVANADGMPVVLAWLALFALIVTCIQFAIPYPLDDDSAYHFAVARLIGEQGILHSFPWTRFSWQVDHYADKEFLYHLLFVPFVQFGFNTTARIVGVIGGTAVLSAIFVVLRTERVRFAGVWALLPLGTAIFLYRFSQVRPHLFSIALAILLLWAYSRRRLLMLAIIAFLYPLTYVAFWQIPLLLVVAAESGLWLSGERRFNWRPLLVLVSAVAAGIMLHPNSVNMVQINWIHMKDILFRNAWGGHVEFNMGEEFEPLSLLGWLKNMLAPSLAALVSLIIAWRQRRGNQLLSVLAVVTLLFCLLTLRTNRFLEYFVPFTFMTLAVTTLKTGKNWLLVAAAASSVVITLSTGIAQWKYIFSAEPRLWQMDNAVIRKIESEIPAGADVFTCGWEYTGTLLTNLPARNFMVALDPTLLYKRDQSLYELWYRTMSNAPPESAEIVRKGFASRYVICLDHSTLHPFFDALAADKKTKVLYSDGKWVAFDLGGVDERQR